MLRSVVAVVAGALALLSLAGPATAAPPPDRQTAIERSRADAAAHAAETAFGPDQQLSARDVIVDPDGATHVRFDRTYRGLEVLGGDLVVHRSAGGAWRGASLTLASAPRLGTNPRLSARQASDRVAPNGNVDGDPRLVVEARQGSPRLAWEVVVTGEGADGSPTRTAKTVDADTGAVLMSVPQIFDVAGTGSSLYSGTVPLETTFSGGSYQLKDPTRGNIVSGDTQNKTDSCVIIFGCSTASAPVFTDADNVWGNGTTSSRQTAGVDAQYSASKTWDYYKNVHGRLGLRGDGVGSLDRIHYGSNYNNANWDPACFCARFGDGDGTNYKPWVSLDIVGHETTHGLTDATAHITYSGEGAGLHESISDIFGTLIEFYANNPSDPPDYTIGEKIRPAGPIRWMDRPSRDSYSPDCWYSGIANIDPHVAAGPGNHFFFLLAVGSGSSAYGNSPTCNGSTVAGIGNADAGKIMFRAVTVYMTSSTNYKSARTATLNAARDLFGSTSIQYTRTAAAWAAVSVT